MVRRYVGYVAVVLFLLTAFSGARAQDQSRVNDKDLARLMQNVRDDTPPFRKSFDLALKKSTIPGDEAGEGRARTGHYVRKAGKAGARGLQEEP